ncbi:MAG: peptidoglycan DD-metalloendopeptidase family protein [Flavobacteriaceae bacterium]|nr:peptidoglycan DD-metalloendopeptidase family protein [Bacteroidia bacterium]NNK87598.1 peptidoglycan DD-metalloendopeptidase family protein [Flavobacteriaceae bacterium]
MKFKCLIGLTSVFIFLLSCKTEESLNKGTEEVYRMEQEDLMEFGYNLNNFTVVRDTIKPGDTFGLILERNNIDYPKIYEIAEKAKDTFDIRKLQIGKPYTLLCSKDESREPQSFIYQPNREDYVVIEFCDSILAYREKKPITLRRKVASGIISDNLSNTMDRQGLPYQLIYDMSDIYAWTVDFFRLQKGDRFKVIYNQRFIDDSISTGIESIEAAYFEHRDESFYAFNYVIDSTKSIADYFDENTKSLRKTFLQAPVKFSRVSSRYNLNRRIAYYGYKRRPHKGTDFAAGVGTPILATANGTVIESTRRGGNGKYVKIRHNPTYSTQYLHMSKRAVNVGDYVKQGDVIGYVGMTGNTAGPHVCYRFWKFGKQVDPFKEKLPSAESVPDSLLTDYKNFISPLKQELDAIPYTEEDSEAFPQESEITQLD